MNDECGRTNDEGSPLAAVREAKDIARHDLNVTLGQLREVVLRIDSPTLRELVARLDGDMHELLLLHRRELAIVTDGRDVQGRPDEAMAEKLRAGVPASLSEGTAPAVPTSANPEVCPPNLEDTL